MITLPMLLMGVLYGIGRVHSRNLADGLIVGLPVLVLIACGIAPTIRVTVRIDDGNRGRRLIEGNEVELEWVPEGPGWPSAGVNWDEAVRRCQHLSYGTIAKIS